MSAFFQQTTLSAINLFSEYTDPTAWAVKGVSTVVSLGVSRVPKASWEPLALSVISGPDAKSKKSRKRTEIQRELARRPGLIHS